MGANAYVYVDVAGMIWSYPLAEINDYIKRLVQAGFEKRILYGTDLLIWPSSLQTERSKGLFRRVGGEVSRKGAKNAQSRRAFAKLSALVPQKLFHATPPSCFAVRRAMGATTQRA